MSRWSAMVLVTAIVAAVVLTATPTVSAAPPTLAVLSPAEGAVIGFGAPVAVTVRVTDFNLTLPGSSPQPGEGHIQVSVDGELLVLVDTVSFSLPLDPGPHLLLLRLAGNDGASLAPDVTATVRITATRGPATATPTLAITYPPEGLHRGIDTAISFRTTGFALVPPGGPVAANEGHLHVLLDGIPYEERWDPAPVEFSDLPTGDHEVTLRLVDSQHQALVPDVSATVHFTADNRGSEDLTFPLQIIAGVLAFMLLLVVVLPRRRRS